MNKYSNKVLSFIMAVVLCFHMLFPITANAAGINYIQNWNDGRGNVNFQYNLNTGNCSAVCTNVGECIVGLGWNPGLPNRVIGYNVGAFSFSGPAFIALYGWTQNALIEYYVVEIYNSYYRTGRTQTMGSVNSDGGTYTLSKNMRYQQPSIVGTSTFPQYWSVRNSSRSLGQNHTLTFGNHVNAWRNAGMSLGNTWGYQAFVCETSGASGYVNMTVW